MNIQIAIRSEVLKMKRTASLYLCLIIALIIPLMTLLLDYGSQEGIDILKKDPWKIYFDEASQGLYFLLLPLFIVLISTLLPQLEFRNNTWKQVFASPLPLQQVFLSKFLTIQGLILLFLVAYNGFMILSLIGINLKNPSLNLFAHRMDWDQLLLANAKTYISALAISALQFWMGLRYRNFIVPVGIGFVGWFAALIIVVEYHLDGRFLPFAYPLLVTAPRFDAMLPTILWSSAGYAFLFLLLGWIDFSRRNVHG